MDGLHDGHRERLRERYERHGLDGFAEHEALELMLTYAIPRKETNNLAHMLLSRFGSLEAVIAARPNELTGVAGIGNRASVLLKLFSDLPSYIHARSSLRNNVKVSNPASAAAFAAELMKNERYECVFVVSLNKNYELLHAERILTGTLTEAPLYPRRIVEAALRHNAYAALILHNHPSGDPAPSNADIEATDAIRAALNSIDIRMYDHIIVGRGRCYCVTRELFIDMENDKAEPQKNVVKADFRSEILIAAEKEL